MKDEEEQIKDLYRQVIQDEIDWEDLKKQKKQFIQEHFAPTPRFVFAHHVLAPALSFCLVLGFFLIALPEQTEKPQNLPAQESLTSKGLATQAPTEAAQARRQEPADLKDETLQYESAPVSITRLRSDVGTTMLYQRTVDNVPVVVIWVFPGK